MILIIWSRGKLNISCSLKFWLQFWPFNYLFLSLNFFLNSYLPSYYFNVSIFRWSLCHFYEIIRLLLCFFSGLYFPPKHYGKNIRSASGFFIAGNPFVKIPGFPFLHFRLKYVVWPRNEAAALFSARFLEKDRRTDWNSNMGN